MPRDLYRITVRLDRVADLSIARARRALELPRMPASQKQWPVFQAVGERLAAEGAQAVLFSSAARTRSLCLCVFEVGLDGLSLEDEPGRELAPPPPPPGLRT
jgi:RES domain